MRGFIILCLTCLTAAAPQGYSYTASQQPHQNYGGQAATTATKDLQHTFAANEPSYALLQQQLEVAPQQSYLAPALPTAPIYETVQPLQFSQHHQHTQQHHEAQEAIVSKRFFIHSAPEEDEQEVHEKFLTVGTARKNFNVVFIKAPVKSAAKTSIKITPAVSEDKTVIYVLAKKPEEAEIDAQVHEPITTTAKPEVYFIKYKTAEEAAHAQQTIQAQYDNLGGSTQVINEGTARVSSVIGVLDAAKQAHVTAEATQQAQAEHAAQAQLAVIVGQQQQQQQEQDLFTAQQYQSQSQQSTSNVGYLPPHRN